MDSQDVNWEVLTTIGTHTSLTAPTRQASQTQARSATPCHPLRPRSRTPRRSRDTRLSAERVSLARATQDKRRPPPLVHSLDIALLVKRRGGESSKSKKSRKPLRVLASFVSQLLEPTTIFDEAVVAKESVEPRCPDQMLERCS